MRWTEKSSLEDSMAKSSLLHEQLRFKRKRKKKRKKVPKKEKKKEKEKKYIKTIK